MAEFAEDESSPFDDYPISPVFLDMYYSYLMD